MAVKNLYPNLPGHLVEFKDGGLQFTSKNDDTSSTKSILILGTAFDGPINEPVKIDRTTVSQLFGPEVNDKGYPNGATLTKYAKQAFKNGFDDVRCMRVTGSQAYTTIQKDTIANTITETASYDGTIEGNAEVSNVELTCRPIIANSIKFVNPTTMESTYPVNAVGEYSGLVTIDAGIADKNSTVNIEYKYKNISAEQTLSGVAVSTDGVNFGNISLGLAADELIYVTTKKSDGSYADDGTHVSDGVAVPVTDGVSVELANGTPLTENVDYQIVNGEIIISPSGSVGLTDEVNIKFYKYTVADKSEPYTFVDVDQTVTLENTPDTVTVVSSGVTKTIGTDYTVTGNVVTLKAGQFKNGANCKVSYTYTVNEYSTEAMTVRAIYGGSIYKTATVQVMAAEVDGVSCKKFVFTKPAAKKYTASEKSFFFTSLDCTTVGELKSALANFALNNVFEIITEDEDIPTADFPVTTALALSNGGEDGVKVTNNEMFEALAGARWKDEDVASGACTEGMVGFLKAQGAYQILENYNVDYIYPAGVYADSKQTINKHSSFHHELALLCAVLTYRTKMTHGFIDVKPNSNTTLVGVQKYVDSLLSYNNVHYMMNADGENIVDTDGNMMDIGWYTSVVVGPEPVMLSDTLGEYYGSPAIAYAALNATIPAQSAPTNKPIPGVKGMKFKFSNKQMNELVANKFVVFKLKNEGTATASSTPYVVDGCTAGASTSDYTRLSTVKVVTEVVDQVREVADPFIGEPNTIEQRNALSALISKRLGYLMERGVIQYFEFEIDATIQQVLLGECNIALTLVPPLELRKITTVVSLRAAA